MIHICKFSNTDCKYRPFCFFFTYMQLSKTQTAKKTLHQTILYDQMIKSNWNRRVDDLIFVLFCFLFYSKLIYTMSIKRSNPTTCDIMCKCNSNKNRQEIEKRKEKKKKTSGYKRIFNYSLFQCEIHCRIRYYVNFVFTTIYSVRKHVHIVCRYTYLLFFVSLFHYFYN